MVFADMAPFVQTMAASAVSGSLGGGLHLFLKIKSATSTMEQDRAIRLASKISAISARTSDKESEGSWSREVEQLQIVRDYFTRNLQAYENYKRQSTEFSMAPVKSSERERAFLVRFSRNGTAEYDWR